MQDEARKQRIEQNLKELEEQIRNIEEQKRVNMVEAAVALKRKRQFEVRIAELTEELRLSKRDIQLHIYAEKRDELIQRLGKKGVNYGEYLEKWNEFNMLSEEYLPLIDYILQYVPDDRRGVIHRLVLGIEKVNDEEAMFRESVGITQGEEELRSLIPLKKEAQAEYESYSWLARNCQSLIDSKQSAIDELKGFYLEETTGQEEITNKQKSIGVMPTSLKDNQ